MTKCELTDEQRIARLERLGAYAQVREVWACRDREKITQALQTDLYEILTRRWHAMDSEEQKIAATDALQRWYH